MHRPEVGTAMVRHARASVQQVHGERRCHRSTPAVRLVRRADVIEESATLLLIASTWITPLARKPTPSFWGFSLSFSVLCLVLAFTDSATVGRTWVTRPETIPMTQDHPSTTDVTLLARLHHDPRDQATWSDFVARSGPKILRWCRRWGLQEADSEDVTRDVLLKLNSRMASFSYDASGSFRDWLMTLAHHVWRDLADERRRAGIGAGDSRIGAYLESLEVGDDLVEELGGVPPRAEGPRPRPRGRCPSEGCRTTCSRGTAHSPSSFVAFTNQRG
jgi:hypothetical protein